MNKGLLTRRKVKEKEGVFIVEELPETTFGRRLGYTQEEMKSLFKIIKNPIMRREIMEKAKKQNNPLSEVVKKLNDQLEKLR